MGYRLDHIMVRGLDVVACEYEHAWRDAGLSDHAAMWAELRAVRVSPRRRQSRGLRATGERE
jgi:hypothetical protein